MCFDTCAETRRGRRKRKVGWQLHQRCRSKGERPGFCRWWPETFQCSYTRHGVPCSFARVFHAAPFARCSSPCIPWQYFHVMHFAVTARQAMSSTVPSICLANGRIIHVCESVRGLPVERGWEFDVDSCPRSVKLSMNNRKAWTTADAFVTVVGNRALHDGEHCWKAQILASDIGFSLKAGVSTSDHSNHRNSKYHLTGWQHRESCCIRDGKISTKHGKNMNWQPGDVLHFRLDCDKGTLTMSNARSCVSDTIDGVFGPVYPCFGFTTKGRGVIVSF